MVKRTIYVHEEHQEIWDKALELVGDVSLASLIASTLQQLIKSLDFEGVENGFEHVVLEVGEWNAEKKISFQGYLIACTPYGRQKAYLTPKGKILIYSDNELDGSTYQVYNKLAEAANEVNSFGDLLYDKELLYHIGVEIGEDYIEKLDI